MAFVDFMFLVIVVMLSACCMAGIVNNLPDLEDRFDEVDFDFEAASDKFLAK